MAVPSEARPANAIMLLKAAIPESERLVYNIQNVLMSRSCIRNTTSPSSLSRRLSVRGPELGGYLIAVIPTRLNVVESQADKSPEAGPVCSTGAHHCLRRSRAASVEYHAVVSASPVLL